MKKVTLLSFSHTHIYIIVIITRRKRNDPKDLPPSKPLPFEQRRRMFKDSTRPKNLPFSPPSLQPSPHFPPCPRSTHPSKRKEIKGRGATKENRRPLSQALPRFRDGTRSNSIHIPPPPLPLDREKNSGPVLNHRLSGWLRIHYRRFVVSS